MQRTYRLIVQHTVEAVQVTADSYKWAAGWCRGSENVEYDSLGERYRYTVRVPTLRALKAAKIGDYILKTPAGDFDVMTRQEFENKYELAI